MSYSRWGRSSWYVFWNASSGKTIDSQVLSAWYSLDGTIDWTYEEVAKLFKNTPDNIINLLRIKYDCSPDEANELQELMQVWVADVKKQFA
jgi:hypothetical protein